MAPKGGLMCMLRRIHTRDFILPTQIGISLDAVGMTLIELILIWAARNKRQMQDAFDRKQVLLLINVVSIC